jgi:DNA-binding CsgD family transcriptional regulator
MVTLNFRIPQGEAPEKNCHRCGNDFTDYSDRGLALICPACKRPSPRPRPGRGALLGKPLSPRQKQVVELVAEAKPYKEIAHILHLHEGTVKAFMSSIFAKTGTSNRTSVAVWWVTRWPCGYVWSSKHMSKTMTTTEIEAAVDAELRGGYKRSRIYRQAMIDELQFRLNGTPMPAPYEPETVAFDAFYSGVSRGHALYQKLITGEEDQAR